ncbi:hypothetical protein PFISCL1PPCAC_13635, partial [Pristionchus fissidentatus]
SSFTPVIDKCRQSGNSTVVLLHFMQSNTVADIRKALEQLNRSPSPSVIQLRTVYGMRLDRSTSDPDQDHITRIVLMGVGVLLFILCLIFLLIVCRAKRDFTKPSPSCLTAAFSPHPMKQSPYWSDITIPVVSKTNNEQSLQSTEL